MQTTIAQVHDLVQKSPRLLADYPFVKLAKTLLRLVSFYPITAAKAEEASKKALGRMTKDKNIRGGADLDGYCRLFIDTLVPYALKKNPKETEAQLNLRIENTAYVLKQVTQKCLLEISFSPGSKVDNIHHLFTLQEAEQGNEYAQQFLRDLFLMQNYYYIKEEINDGPASSITNNAFVNLYRGKIRTCKTLFDVKQYLNDYCMTAVKKRKESSRLKRKNQVFS